MKKTWIILSMLLVLCTCYVQGQKAAYYQFKTVVGNGTYVPLDGATELKAADDVLGAFDDYAYLSATEVKAMGALDAEATYEGFAIGFDFKFAGQTFNHFIPTSEGYIVLASGTFGKTDIQPKGSDFALNAVGLRGDETTYRDINTVVAYKTEGEAGHRILLVEYRNQYYAYDDVSSTGKDGLNYTIRLYEDGGKIELYFGSMVSGKASVWYRIGLNGGTDDKHYRQPTSGDWTNTSYSTGAKAIGATDNFPQGMVWEFTEPAPCEAPTATATATIDIIRPEGFHVNHDIAADAADGYVTFVSEEPLAEGVAPENGKAYTYNDLLGTAEYVDGGDDFSRMNVKVNKEDHTKTYYVYTYLYNERCKGDRTYGSRPAPAILRSAPQLAMTYENDKISLLPQGTDTLVVLASTVNGLKDMSGVNIGNVGNFGIPTAATKVGDTLWTAEKQFGGIVLYKGLEPAVAFDYTATLKPFTNYHFAAFRRDATGGYVSWFAQADTLTPPVIPFIDDFSTHVPYAEPQGYTGNGTFQVQRDGSVYAQIALKSTDDAARLILETPEMIFPTEAAARLVLEYQFVVPKSRFASSLTAEDYEGDNGLYFSVSEDGGEWQQVYAIDKSNPDYFADAREYKKKFITLGEYSGKPCRVRIEVVGENLSGMYPAKVTIQSISIIEKPACDAPLTVSVLTEKVYGDSAYMAWQAFDADQNTATVAYRLADETAWHTLLAQTSRDTLGVGGLPHRANVVLGAKTLCAGGKESVYTESTAFKTGYQAPFVEDFSEPGVYEGRMPSEKLYAVPEGWTFATDPLPESGPLTLETSVAYGLSRYVPLFDKNTQDVYDPEQPGGDLCVQLGGMKSANETWFVMPPVVLAENHGAVLSFDAALMKEAAPAVADGIDADAKLIVYAAAMTAEDALTSQTFTAANAILTLDKAQLAEIGELKHLEAALTGLSGKVRIGFYYNFGAAGENDATLNQLYLDNIAVAAPCGAVVDLETVTVGETTVEIRWRAYPNVAKYSVTVTETEGTATPETSEVTEPKAILTGLEKATAYKVSVTYACTDGNAPAAEIPFTTGGMPCDVPTDLTATSVTQTSAVLSWTGEAETYKLEFKETAATEYVSRDVTGKTYTLTNLHAGTDYVFRVKAVCNAAAGDESDWSEDKAFKTADLTCFAPTALTVTPSFSQAEATWEGEADQYQLAYKQGTAASTPWTVVPVAGKKYMMTGLKTETLYSVRVRSICAAGDTSAYSEIKEFSTIAMEPCPVPANLRVEDTTLTSAKLAWDKDEQHEGFLLRYRVTTATAWDSVKDLKEASYALASLTAKTAYIWSVNAFCSENRVSGWATANEFSTLEEKQQDTTANEGMLRAAFNLYATEGRIHILNRGGLRIDRVEVYTTDGRLMYREVLNTTFNVSIPMTGSRMPVMVVVKTDAGSVVYKQMLP